MYSVIAVAAHCITRRTTHCSLRWKIGGEISIIICHPEDRVSGRDGITMDRAIGKSCLAERKRCDKREK